MVNGHLLRAAVLVALAGMLASCGGSGPSASIRLNKSKEHFSESVYGKASPRVTAYGPVPKGGGRAMVGAPYRVAGRTYIPRDNPRYSAVGLASWYGAAFHGRRTANGEVYDVNGLTAAHPTLPLPSYVRVTNLLNGRSLIVRVNDRGPFKENRIIDVSARVANMLGFINKGTTKVRVDYMGPAQMDGRDERTLLASYRDPNGGNGGGIFDWNNRGNDAPVAVALAPIPRVAPDAPPPPPVTVAADADVAGAPPLVLMPAYAPDDEDDPLAPLIMRASFVNSFAAQPPVTAAQRAATTLAETAATPPDLQSALDAAAASKARELRGTSAVGIVVQLGVFGDADNAARVAADFRRFGEVQTDTQESGGRMLTVVRVGLDPSVSADDVAAAANAQGLRGAFIYTH